MQTIVAALADRARSSPDSVAVIWKDIPVTVARFDEMSTAGGIALVHAGVRARDRVLLHLPNGLELMLAYYACFKAGATAVPVPRGSSANEMAQIVETCQPCIGLTSASLPSVHVAGMRWLTLDEHWPVAASAGRLPDIEADSIAVILHTSGTTGRAKGAMHSHRALQGLLSLYRTSSPDADTTVIALPLVHGYAFFTFVSTISTGGKVILLGDFDPATMLDAIDRYAGTLAIATPAMAHALVEEQVRAPRRLAALSRINVSGDMVPVGLQQRFNQVFGNRMRRTYGATEMGPVAREIPGAVFGNSLGFPFAGVDIRILDESGREIPAQQCGEIVVRSPWMATGYCHDSAGTAAVFRNGYFHTGDLGFRDRDQRLHFAGRKKEIIVRAGINISPVQIEDVLRQHPSVAEVAVWGLPDPVLGQTVAAWVIPKTPVPAEQLREFARPLLTEHKCPDQVFFVTELPKTAQGKIKRRALVPPATMKKP